MTQKFERPHWNSVSKRPTLKVSLNQKTCHLPNLNIYAKVKTSDIFIMYLTYLTILQSFDLMEKNIKFSVKIVGNCCELEIYPRSLIMVWTGKAQWVVPYCKAWHLSHLNVKVLDEPRHLADEKACQLSPLHTHQSHELHCAWSLLCI